jgi:penicillin-binding protein 1A
MDYSKKGIEHKQQYIKSSNRRMVSKARIIIFRVCISCVVLVAIVGSLSAYGFMKGIIDSAPDISQIDKMSIAEASTIYDKDGNPIEKLIGAQSNRKIVKITDIPKVVQNAFIAIEDERFRKHNGIDLRGIFRAAFRGLTTGDFDQGASTITQQLLKNQIFGGGMEKTFTSKLKRKLQEQYLAIQLENKLKKNIILQDYLNTINLGATTYGVQTASKRYFNKNVKELTLSEAAVIAGITKSPVYLNPITHPEDNAKRREEILNNMLEQKYCTQKEYDEAMADDVYERIKTVNSAYEKTEKNTAYSYFVDAVINQVQNDLVNKLGYDEATAANLLYSGGLNIYTTQDSTIQKICNKVYSDENNFPKIGTQTGAYWELNSYALSIQKGNDEDNLEHYNKNDILKYFKDYKDPKGLYVDDDNSKFSLLCLDKKDMLKRIKEFKNAKLEKGDSVRAETDPVFIIQPQSSLTVMDQHTGHVVALIGGRGTKEGSLSLNRATSSKRQPGSAFKILSAYLPALDQVGLTLGTVKDDSAPYYYPNTKKKVKNGNSNQGLVTLRQGIYNSMNIVTVKTFVDVTPQLGYDYLLKLGFTTLVDSEVIDGKTFSDIQLPTCLGGITKGIYNYELTAAYAAIANRGVYTEPIFYTKIVDRDGNVLLNNKPETKTVMKESTAWLLTSAMEDVVKKGTGTLCKLSTDMAVAGKTGTTTKDVDLWFAGYTPYYTMSIWSGFDNNHSQVDKTYHKKIWRTIMDEIDKKMDLETKSFTMPDSIVSRKICSKSGKLAVEGLCDCSLDPNDGVYTEYFARGTEPTEYCDVHRKVKICTESNKLATKYCPADKIQEVVYLIKKETGKTMDTPYILPNEECPLHTAGFFNGIGDFFDNDPNNQDDPNNQNNQNDPNNQNNPNDQNDQNDQNNPNDQNDDMFDEQDQNTIPDDGTNPNDQNGNNDNNGNGGIDGFNNDNTTQQ